MSIILSHSSKKHKRCLGKMQAQKLKALQLFFTVYKIYFLINLAMITIKSSNPQVANAVKRLQRPAFFRSLQSCGKKSKKISKVD